MTNNALGNKEAIIKSLGLEKYLSKIILRRLWGIIAMPDTCGCSYKYSLYPIVRRSAV
jgi:hypothetical protein